MMKEEITTRPKGPDDRELVTEILRERWAGEQIVTRGVLHDASRLPGIIAVRGSERVGFATYRIAGDDCELVTIDALARTEGVGTALLRAVEAAARDAGCARVWLITTNDNLPAVRFYQRRGYHLVAVHRDALSTSRLLKPGIPEVGLDGIPLRDELELEHVLSPGSPESAPPAPSGRTASR